MKKSTNLKEKYSFKNYKPNKNAKSVIYNGTTYLSKIQCCVLEGITRKELDVYLKEKSAVEDIVSEELPKEYFDVED